MKAKKQYERFWKLTDIFNLYNSGIQTGKDELVVDFDSNALFQRIREVKDSDNENEIRQKYQLNDTSGWSLERFKKLELNRSNIINCNYRPFDVRSIYYETKALKRDRSFIMQHFDKNNNIGIVFLRQVVSENWSHIFINKYVVESSFISNKTREWNYVAPLYIFDYKGNHDEHGNGYLFKQETKQDNFTPEFRKFIKTKYQNSQKINKEEIEKLKSEIENNKKTLEETKTILELQTEENLINSFKNSIENINKIISENHKKLKSLEKQQTVKDLSPSPEEVLGYIYAVLHSPTYREKYAEFLKFDFPRIPFVDSYHKFETLSKLGRQLIQVHLLNTIPQGESYENIAVYMGDGENEVEKSEYADNKLYINKNQYFDNIPNEIYEFKIGAYQVLHKYLKDRKGRKLSYDEIINIEKICKALKFTILQMEEIDKETISWI